MLAYFNSHTKDFAFVKKKYKKCFKIIINKIVNLVTKIEFLLQTQLVEVILMKIVTFLMSY